MQGNALHQFGEFQLQPPEKGAEVAVVDVSEQRLVLLWSTGVLQSFSYQAAASGQVVRAHKALPCHMHARRNSNTLEALRIHSNQA